MPIELTPSASFDDPLAPAGPDVLNAEGMQTILQSYANRDEALAVAVGNLQDDMGDGFESGTYNPAFSNVSNLSAPSSLVCWWQRVGDLVTVTVHTTATASSGNKSFEVSIPAAAQPQFDFSSVNAVIGHGSVGPSSGGQIAQGVLVTAVDSSKRALVKCDHSATSGILQIYFTFSYRV